MSEDTTPQGGTTGETAPPDPGATQVMPAVQPAPQAGSTPPAGTQYAGPPGGGTPGAPPTPPEPKRFPTWLAAIIGLALGVALVAGGWALYQAGRGSALPDDTGSVEATTTTEILLPQDTDDGVVIIDEDGEEPPDDEEPPPDDEEPPPDDGGEPPPDDVEPPPPAATWVTKYTLRCEDDMETSGWVRLPQGRYRFIVEVVTPRSNALYALYTSAVPERQHVIWTTTRATGTGFKSDPLDLAAGHYSFLLRQSGGPSTFQMRVQRLE